MRALLLLLAVAGCGDVFDPPATARRTDPPAAFREVWDRLEVCAGRRGDFARIRWWFVPDSEHLILAGQEVAGVWAPPHDIWVLEMARDPWNDYWLARHEMLHDLLGTGEHPAAVFERCGSLNPLP